MTGKISLLGFLILSFAVASGAFNGVSAHGNDHEYRDPGSGMEYPMESEGMDEYCPGCGMMGGYGMVPGMMGGYGMGPGMMRGQGMGPGMMGGQGMGPGMMGGQGMGPGMTGGQGMMGGSMGPGMMGRGMMYGLELDSEQRKEMHRIRSELRKRNWALQGEILDERDKLFELYAEDSPDAKKIGSVYGKIFDLRRQMIEAGIEAQNRQRAVLTDEQRRRLENVGHQRNDEQNQSKPGAAGQGHGGRMMGG